jgi:hypothetical protein
MTNRKRPHGPLVSRLMAALLLAGAASPEVMASTLPGKKKASRPAKTRLQAGQPQARPAAPSAAGADTKAEAVPAAPAAPAEVRLPGPGIQPHRDLAEHYTRIIGSLWLGPWADLRNADLSGQDLRNLDLRHADLRGANLAGSDLAGTLLEGALVFQADIQGAANVNLKGAVPHPFFDLADEDRIGTLAFLVEAGGIYGLPRALTCSPDGILTWAEASGNRLIRLYPTGARSVPTLDGETAVHRLYDDGQGMLWWFGDAFIGTASHAALAAVQVGGKFPMKAQPAAGLERPSALAPGVNGQLMIQRGKEIIFHEAALKDGRLLVFKGEHPVANEPLPGESMALSYDGTMVLLVAPGRDEVRYLFLADGTTLPLPLKAGSRPSAIVQGAGNDAWILLPGRSAIGRLTLADHKVQEFTRRLPKGAESSLDALVLGPDGNAWFADRTLCRLGRVTPEGEIREFQLPRGCRPGELVATPDGRIVFTVVGKDRLGSIRVKLPEEHPGAGQFENEAPSPDRDADADLKDWAGPLYVPRPARKPKNPLTRQQREELYDARMKAAEERFLAERAAAEDEPPAPRQKRAEDAKEKKAAPAPAAADGKAGNALAREAEDSPALRLLDLNVNLPHGVIRHILKRHAHGTGTSGIWFAPAHSTPEGLEALLAEGLEEAGEIGRIKSSNGYGRFITFCMLASGATVGEAATGSTATFAVLTEPYYNGKVTEHDVWTAYPVPDW